MNDGKNKDAAGKGGDGEDDEGDDDEDEDDDDLEYDDVKPAVPPQARNDKKDNVPEDVGGERKKQQQQQQQRKNKNNSGPKNGGGGKNRKKSDKNNGLEDEEEDQGGPAFAFFRLLKDIGTHVSSTKNFWKRLPYEVCNNEIAVIETGQNTSCWNGSALAR